MRRTPMLLVLFFVGGGHPVLAQESRPPVEVRALGTWRHGRLREVSGLAVSRRHPGIIWTHNDSGDGPFVYATDTTGALLAAFEIAGARAVDWEDIALGPCPAGLWVARTCLYIADTGDNSERRTRVVLYAVPEPDTVPQGVEVEVRTEVARSLRLQYPGRPHDAEALVAHADGRLDLITKGRSGRILRFEIGPEAWRGSDVVLGTPDTLPLVPAVLLGRWVTGGDADPDGVHVVLRTYTEVYRLRIGERWTLAGPACRMGLIEPQGEGIGVLGTGELILGSEGLPVRAGGLTLVRCNWE